MVKWMKDGVEFQAPLVIEGLAHWAPTYEEMTASGYRLVEIAPEPRPVTVADYDRAMEKHLRVTRMLRGYTDREPTMYINSANPRWKQDALDWVAFVDEVMTYALEVENDFIAGRPVPTLESFKARLPEIHWTVEL